MIVTVDVVSTSLWRAFGLWMRTNRAWHRKGSEWVAGRRVLGVQYTFRGRRVHRDAWGPKPPLFPNVLRGDGWGWFPDLRRVFVLARWDDEQSLDAFRAGSPWPAGAEVWHARLRPVKVKGEIKGRTDLPEMLDTRGTDELPGVFVTWNNMWIWRLPMFRLWVRRIADQQHGSEGALASFLTGNVLRPLRFSAFTLSCWERLGAGVSFSYKGEPHKAVIKWYGNPHRFGEPWWGRFVLERTEGTIAGRNPFEGVGRVDAGSALGREAAPVASD